MLNFVLLIQFLTIQKAIHMKNIAIIVTLLFVGATASAQHPLSKSKGANAKNYKAAKDTNREAVKISLFAVPSEKYASGANAKNTRIDTQSAEQMNVYPKQGYTKLKGANVKNSFSVQKREMLGTESDSVLQVDEKLEKSDTKINSQDIQK